MTAFKPGHLHLERHAVGKQDAFYDVWLDYEVSHDSRQGKGMLFTMHGSIQGNTLNESFFLPQDQVYNFASAVTRIAEKYGVPKHLSSIGSAHKHYDAMFDDVRAKMGFKSGDAVNIERFE